MKSSAVAKRLAKAVIDVAREDKSIEKVGGELRTAAEAFKASPELYRVLLNPMYKIEERKALVEKVSSSLSLSAGTARLLDILVETRSLKLLDGVSAAYSRLEDEASGRIKATVEAPADMDAGEIEEIKKKLSASTGKEVVVTFAKNPALIGGLVVRMENTILDGSIKTQLELMKEKILEGVV